MARTRIKFCGITSVADALAAAECGADAIGLVLHAESRRRIDAERAAEIVRELPAFVSPVGLFVDAPFEVIEQTAARIGLRHIQLHGTESPEFASRLRGVSVVKAVHVTAATLASEVARWDSVASLGGILLETGSMPQLGGTGVENDWAAIKRAQLAGAFLKHPLIVAGGLRADIVGSVVEQLHPWAVDVSSGIESSPGVKSLEKMQAFVRAVRDADSL